MRFVSRGLGAINEAGKYTCATFEYTGRVSYGLLKNGGRLVACSVSKVTTPIAKGIVLPFVGMKKMTDRLFGRRTYLEGKFKSVEDKLEHIEEKLASMEKRGFVVGETAHRPGASRELDPGRQALLRQIVEANKSLID